MIRISLENRLFFRRNIITWYKLNGRSFPWRETRDPYLILIAEIMLQRTRAEQVLPVYNSFTIEYPDIYKLAGADIASVKKYFDVLGLQKRSTFLLNLCEVIVNNYDGTIPAEYDLLKNLPCVGPYTASAVLAFGFNKPLPIVDSNVIRILNRFFNLQHANHKPNKGIMLLSEVLISKKNIREYNYGILDVSSLICGPTQNPKCSECPLFQRCYRAI